MITRGRNARGKSRRTLQCDCGVHPCTPPCALRPARCALRASHAAVRFCSCRTVEPRVGSRLPALGHAKQEGPPDGWPFSFSLAERGGLRGASLHPALRAAGQPAAVRFCSCRTVEPRVGSRLPALGHAKQEGPPDGWPFSFSLAERGGFEPPRRYKRLPDFESGTFNRSATSPVSPAYRGRASYEEVAGFTSRHVQESETLLTPQLVGSSCHRDDGVLPAAPSFSCATP